MHAYEVSFDSPSSCPSFFPALWLSLLDDWGELSFAPNPKSLDGGVTILAVVFSTSMLLSIIRCSSLMTQFKTTRGISYGQNSTSLPPNNGFPSQSVWSRITVEWKHLHWSAKTEHTCSIFEMITELSHTSQRSSMNQPNTNEFAIGISHQVMESLK